MREHDPIQKSIVNLADHIGKSHFVSVCVDLLEGAPRERHVEALHSLTGHSWNLGDPVFDPDRWKDYWIRTWGARGLLYVWDDAATSAIVAGLADEHYRPAEMCLKVATRYEVAGTGDGAAILARHELARVRVQALRCLGVVGDSEHIEAVQNALCDSEPAVRHQARRSFDALAERLGR